MEFESYITISFSYVYLKGLQRGKPPSDPYKNKTKI